MIFREGYSNEFGKLNMRITEYSLLDTFFIIF